MTTRTEHIARLAEMSVRAQQAADWLAQNVEHGTEYAKQQYGDHLAAKNADIERLTRRAEFAYNALTATHRDTFQRAETAERERDAAMQAHADDIAEKDAEIERLREEVATTERYRDDVIQACAAAERERDTLRRERDAATDARRDAERQRDQARGDADALAELLVKTADAIGGDPHTSDLPRLVRELRDERDRQYGEVAKIYHAGMDLADAVGLDVEDNGILTVIGCAARELSNLKARAVVLPDDWREQLANLAASRLKDEDDARELLDSWREPASREPGTPGQAFHDGDRVAWHHGKGVENGTVDIACHAGKTLLRLDNGKRVWVHPEAVTPIGEREGDR